MSDDILVDVGKEDDILATLEDVEEEEEEAEEAEEEDTEYDMYQKLTREEQVRYLAKKKRDDKKLAKGMDEPDEPLPIQCEAYTAFTRRVRAHIKNTYAGSPLRSEPSSDDECA